MMDNPQRKTMLAKIIKYEQQNLCDVIDVQQIENITGMLVKDLQKQFNRWTNQRLKTQTI